MKFLKNKLFAVSVVLLATLLTGCDDDTDYLNNTETVLLQQCENETANSPRLSCSMVFANTIHMARHVYSNNNGAGNPLDQPFLGQGLTFIIEDKSFKERHPDMKSLNEIWHEYTGKWLYDAPQAPVSNDTKKVGQSYVLSPTMYDELIQAVKTCNRATVEAMNFKSGANLSAEQYDKAMSIIIECKQSQLDQAINQK